MKFRLLLTFVSVAFLLWVLATAVIAQEEPPPPYAGLKNPFPWSDAPQPRRQVESYISSPAKPAMVLMAVTLPGLTLVM